MYDGDTKPTDGYIVNGHNTYFAHNADEKLVSWLIGLLYLPYDVGVTVMDFDILDKLVKEQSITGRIMARVPPLFLRGI